MALAGYLCRRCKLLIASPISPFQRTLKSRSVSTHAETTSKSPSRQHEEEVAKFDRLSSSWWSDDKDPLLLMNSVRVPLLKSLLAECDAPEIPPQILDVGCGGGYLAEELAKQRFSVTAIDPSQDMITIATRHTDIYAGELDLKYQCATVEEIKEQFDLVVSSEVVEHVPCVKSFVNQCAQRVKPGGGLMFTTINRTVQSWLFGIILAENVAGLVPPGTHEYNKLVPPEMLTGAIADCGFEVLEVTGLRFNPVTRQWSRTSDLSINYAVTAVRTQSETAEQAVNISDHPETAEEAVNISNQSETAEQVVNISNQSETAEQVVNISNQSETAEQVENISNQSETAEQVVNISNQSETAEEAVNISNQSETSGEDLVD